MPVKPKKPTDNERLEHMLTAITKIFRYTENLDVEGYIGNDMVQDAVMKNFEVIGEASYHLSSELKEAYPHIEWKGIEGFRHVLVHDYYKIDAKRLWNTKEQFLPSLQENLEALIEAEL